MIVPGSETENGIITLLDSDGVEDKIVRTFESLAGVGRNQPIIFSRHAKRDDVKRISLIGPYFGPYSHFRQSTLFSSKFSDLPDVAVTAITPEKSDRSEAEMEVIGGPKTVQIQLAEKNVHLPSDLERTGPGTLFRSVTYVHGPKTAVTGVEYGSIDKDGEYHPCVKSRKHYDARENRTEAYEEILHSAARLCAGLNIAAEQDLFWNVRAREAGVTMRFGVPEQQVKSLFYARSAPITDSGRRRPILHWVHSHKRRLKEGIEFDVSEHLRGIEVFEMNGTEFRITQPQR